MSRVKRSTACPFWCEATRPVSCERGDHQRTLATLDVDDAVDLVAELGGPAKVWACIDGHEHVLPVDQAAVRMRQWAQMLAAAAHALDEVDLRGFGLGLT